MKREVTYAYSLSRNDLIAAVVAYVGLPDGTVPESFSLKSEALAEPEPVCFMRVLDGDRP